MRNEYNSKIQKILDLGKKFPLFSFDTFSSIEKDRVYLKILFARAVKSNKIIRLKKGFYVTREYVENVRKNQRFTAYIEFLANDINPHSYLSLEYVLYKYNILTEIPVNYTSITENKTKSFNNSLGVFLYHKIKKELFCGYSIKKEGDYSIAEASKSKALFDFLYLRKNSLIDMSAIKELRLNLEDFSSKDILEFKNYIDIEDSKKMKQIFNWLFK